METIERKLKDYKGYEVYKVVDDFGTKKDITYMVNNKDGDNMNCFINLKELKKWINTYYV